MLASPNVLWGIHVCLNYCIIEITIGGFQNISQFCPINSDIFHTMVLYFWGALLWLLHVEKPQIEYLVSFGPGRRD